METVIAKEILEKRTRAINLLTENINETYTATALTAEQEYCKTICFVNEMLCNASDLAELEEEPMAYGRHMGAENDVERKLRIIKETLEAAEEIYLGHLDDQDKCEKIVFLLRTMFESLAEENESECCNKPKE